MDYRAIYETWESVTWLDLTSSSDVSVTVMKNFIISTMVIVIIKMVFQASMTIKMLIEDSLSFKYTVPFVIITIVSMMLIDLLAVFIFSQLMWGTLLGLGVVYIAIFFIAALNEDNGSAFGITSSLHKYYREMEKNEEKLKNYKKNYNEYLTQTKNIKI